MPHNILNIKARGELELENSKGEKLLIKNRIVNNGAQILAKCLVSEEKINYIKFGDWNENGPTETTGDMVDLEAPRTWIKSIDFVSFPVSNTVAFNFSLNVDEFKDSNIKEYGLFFNNQLFSRISISKYGANFVKDTDTNIIGQWRIIFERAFEEVHDISNLTLDSSKTFSDSCTYIFNPCRIKEPSGLFTNANNGNTTWKVTSTSNERISWRIDDTAIDRVIGTNPTYFYENGDTIRGVDTVDYDNSNIISFEANDINIIKVDISDYINLESIIINNNDKLQYLITENNINLKHIDISSNSIIGIDTYINSKLKTLDVSNNLLNSVELVNNKELETLDVSNNNLIRINILKNNKVTDINVSNNLLNSSEIDELYTDLVSHGNYWGNLDTHDNQDPAKSYWNMNTLLLRGWDIAYDEIQSGVILDYTSIIDNGETFSNWLLPNVQSTSIVYEDFEDEHKLQLISTEEFTNGLSNIWSSYSNYKITLDPDDLDKQDNVLLLDVPDSYVSATIPNSTEAFSLEFKLLPGSSGNVSSIIIKDDNGNNAIVISYRDYYGIKYEFNNEWHNAKAIDANVWSGIKIYNIDTIKHTYSLIINGEKIKDIPMTYNSSSFNNYTFKNSWRSIYIDDIILRNGVI